RAGGNGTFFIGEAKVVADRWYHMALVRNDSLEIYFVDGQVVDTSMASSGGSIWDRTVLILGATRIPDRFFAGAIDDVRIYEAALTADQVELLYRNSPT
ncbi:MAG: hypothetical protein GWN71_03805, partial [Gammaproteobacteria bacterium]|nr:hypothetical protein [Gammaproteobacteria bacterium]